MMKTDHNQPVSGGMMRDTAGLLGLLGALAVLILFFGVYTDKFLSVQNLSTIANQIPTALIVAVGMTFVLIAGDIDLSVGSVLALSSALLGLVMTRGLPVPVALPMALLGCILAGLACGTLNGAIVARWKIPSFIVTLGMLEAARGITLMITDSQAQYIGAPIEWIHKIALLGIPLPFLLAVLVVACGHILLTKTQYGRHLIAMGHSEEVARLSGIRVKRVRMIVFSLCGALTGLAAILHTARLSTAEPNTGVGFELEVIAAVVIGGTSLTGGQGSVLRSALGVLIIAILGSGLAQAGAQDPTKRLITGMVIIAAVILDRYRRKNA